jgi:glycosyltransferase involved in cell wall biosynthesis
MALALPIVASDLPGLREVVEDGKNALLVQPADADAIGVGVDTLLQDRQRLAHYGQRSREIFEERFTLERSATRMIDLYHRVAEKVH